MRTTSRLRSRPPAFVARLLTPASALALAVSLLSSVNLCAQPSPTPSSASPSAQPAPPSSSSPASRALTALLDEHVRWLNLEDPLDGARRGLEECIGKLRDESPAAYARRTREVADRLARVKAIDAARLPESERVNADLLRYELQRAADADRFHFEQLQVDARNGPQIWLPQIGLSLPMRTPIHAKGYASVLEAVPQYIDQVMQQMQLGLDAGRVPPRIAMVGADLTCAALGSEEHATDPTSSPFFDPLRMLPTTDPDVIRAKTAISKGIVPSFQKLADFLKTQYIPKCRETVGASDSVDGLAWYTFQLEGHTTTRLTPDEIHAIGLSEVARIRAEMFEVIARTDFPRPPAGTKDEFFSAFVSYLRNDPRFYYTNADDLLRDYRDICKRVDAELPTLFNMLPRNSYGVKELPPLAAPSSPSAYYYPGSLKGGLSGTFMVNTYKLDQRPKYEMRALALHESVPGHHLQIAISQELEGVHPFRTMMGYTAFVEGWALYAERLGMEMSSDSTPPTALTGGRGIYTDPYDDFGRLSFEMWRATRLVVDTGMHAKGWTRDRAIAFMLTNTALSSLNIEREVDRYIGWPGQACGYKIGEIKIRELRRAAEQSLGASFDLRAFHDAILGAGAVPLPVLEARVNRWIQGRGASLQ